MLFGIVHVVFCNPMTAISLGKKMPVIPLDACHPGESGVLRSRRTPNEGSLHRFPPSRRSRLIQIKPAQPVWRGHSCPRAVRPTSLPWRHATGLKRFVKATLLAAERRKNAAHGASRGQKWEPDKPRPGRKIALTPTISFSLDPGAVWASYVFESTEEPT